MNVWIEVAEKVNVDFESSTKEIWAFVERKTKGKKKAIEPLRVMMGCQ